MVAEKNTLPPLYASHPDAYQTAQNPPPPQPQPYYPNPYQIPATPLTSIHQAPAQVDCPACMYRVMTRVDPVSGNTTHAWAASFCFCCCLGCLAYLTSSLKDVDHYCGRCGVLLATWHNSGRVEIRHKPAMTQQQRPDIKPPPQLQPQPAPQPAPQPQPQFHPHPQPQQPPAAMTITQMPTPIPSPPPQVLTPEQEIEMKMELPPPQPYPKTQAAPIEMDASVEVQHTPAPSPGPDSSVSVSDSGIGAGRKHSEISGIHENQNQSQRGL